MIPTELKDAWVFFRYELPVLGVIILIVSIPLELVTLTWEFFRPESTGVEILLISVVSLIFLSLQAAAIVFYIASVVAGQRLGISDSYALARSLVVPYIGLSLATLLLVAGGFILLIVPGIYVACRLSFAPFILVIHKDDPMTSIRKSWEQADRHVLKIFVGYFLITLVMYPPLILLEALLPELDVVRYPVEFVANLIWAVGGSMYTIYAFRIYEKITHVSVEDA